MLNNLTRKRLAITVVPRKPRVVEEADATLSIAHTKKEDGEYLSICVPKPRPAGLVGSFDLQVGELEDLLTDPLPGDYVQPVAEEKEK